MENNTQEKLGRTIIDGKIVDLDSASSKELKEYAKKLKAQEKKIQSRINKILDIEDER